jgi:DNA repair photolyase
MLGELYTSVGYALETTQAILGKKNAMSCNVAIGCRGNCRYCYGPNFMHVKREDWCKKLRLPKENPAKLIAHQLTKIPAPEGVFFCYTTDPLILETIVYTLDAIHELHLKVPQCRTAVLTKTARLHLLPDHKTMRYGATIVSFSEDFNKTYEPGMPTSYLRLVNLQSMKTERDAFVFVSAEPYPCSAIQKQDLYQFLDKISFADLIVFGKTNYDARASTPEAKAEYKDLVAIFRDYCKQHKINGYVKAETLKFIGEIP